MSAGSSNKIADKFKVSFTYRRKRYFWNVLVFDKHRDYEGFVKDGKKETRALTWVTTKIGKDRSLGNICFSRKYLSPQLVIHELFHAVVSFWRYGIGGGGICARTKRNTLRK